MIRQFFQYHKTFTTKQAIGFYLVHLTAVCFFGVLVMLAYIAITGRTDESSLLQLGTGISMLSSLYISFRVVEAKKAFRNKTFLFIALSSAFFAFIGGSLLGLLPSTVLSTKSKDKNN